MGSQLSIEQLFKSHDLITRMEAADVEFIGKGRFGKVFRCIEKGGKNGRNRRVFAVKVMGPDLQVNSLHLKCDCKKLCSYSNFDNHDRLVETFAYKVTGNSVYLGIEHCSGGSLAHLIAVRQRIDDANTQRVTRQILEGLFHLHEHNIIHGDLHPGNVLFDNHGNAKLSDFGMYACLPNVDCVPLGMPGFVAPELRQRKNITASCDNWSAGAITVTMLVGKPPSSSHDGAEDLPQNADEKIRRFVSHCFLSQHLRPPSYWLLRYSYVCGTDQTTEAEKAWSEKIKTTQETIAQASFVNT